MKQADKIKIGDICNLVTSGGTPKTSVSSYYFPKEIPWLKTAEVNYCRIRDTEAYISKEGLKHSSAKMIPVNSVIVAMYGQGDTAGRVAINKIPLATNQACCNLVINPEIADYEYVYYSLCILYNKLVSLKNGGAQPNLNAGMIKAIEIPLPNLKIQRRIAAILSAYDNLIENNQKQIKLLEEAARRLYKEWFVDLRFPGWESVPVADGVPEGWRKVSLTDLLEIKYGKAHQALENGNIPAYGSGGLVRKVKPVLYSGESVLIPRKGSLNNILYVSGDFWTIDTMFYSVPLMPNVVKFAYLFLLGLNMNSFNIGAAVPSMTVNILAGMRLTLPSKYVLDDFEQVASPLFNQKKVLYNEIELATEARDRLLPKLIRGDLEV